MRTARTKVLIKKDYVGAIDGMTKVLRMDDSYSYAVFYMGRSYQLLGDTGNADRLL